MMKEKTFEIGGFRVGLATDVGRADRLRRSPVVQYLVRPGMQLLRRGRHPSVAAPASLTGTQAPPHTGDAEAAAIWERIAGIGWYHTIDLGHGVATPGFIDNRPTVHLFGIPQDLTGKRCLDIGTYDGFWAFEMERRGASEVIGIDVDSPADHDLPLPLKKRAIEEQRRGDVDLRDAWTEEMSAARLQWPGEGFRVAAGILGSRARRRALDVYDLAPESFGMFDLVLISQLLLRMRDPQTVIENMLRVTAPGGCAIVAEPYDPELEALKKPASEFIGTTRMGIWWAHSIKSMRLMMQTAGFERVEEVSRVRPENRAGAFAKVVLKGYTPSL